MPMKNKIVRPSAYEKSAYSYIPIIVIGAGESGIAMGCQLKEQLGFDQFRIFDRQGGPGGTWWINSYPGVACDIPAVFYSFSFAPNYKWTTFHPPGLEIVKYLRNVCEQYDITDKIEYNTDVKECRWLEDEQLWEVTLVRMTPGSGDLSSKKRNKKIQTQGWESVVVHQDKVKAKVVVSAVGGLVEPKGWPDNIPGADIFEGPIFHSARWDYTVDFKDKNVVVVGTGCSAAQFVPRLTKEMGAKSATQLMRSPPWVVPRPEPPGGLEWWEKWAPRLLPNVPGLGKAFRLMVAALAEYDWRLFGMSEYAAKERAKVEKELLTWMRKTVPQKYHEILTPDYGVGCKRRILDAAWFPSLNDPRIELTTQPLSKVNSRSVVLGPGRTFPDPKDLNSKAPIEEREVPADIIVLANGFDTTRWLHPLTLKGRGGADLLDQMEERGGPQAYLGTAMDNFPNFFLVFGPNTATGHSSVILATENMVNHSIKFIRELVNGDVETIEVKQEAEIAYTMRIQERLAKTVWASGCNSWYFHTTDKGSWNSTAYPYSQIHFTLKCMFPKWSDWNITYTRQGIWKQRLRRGLALLFMTAAIIAAYNKPWVAGRARGLWKLLQVEFAKLSEPLVSRVR